MKCWHDFFIEEIDEDIIRDALRQQLKEGADAVNIEEYFQKLAGKTSKLERKQQRTRHEQIKGGHPVPTDDHHAQQQAAKHEARDNEITRKIRDLQVLCH